MGDHGTQSPSKNTRHWPFRIFNLFEENKMKRKHRTIIKHSLIGLLVSLIILTFTIIAYYTTITPKLVGTEISFFFKVLAILYSWPFMIIAFIFNLFGVEIFHIPLLIIISTLAYIGIGALVGHHAHKKAGKGSGNRRRSIR